MKQSTNDRSRPSSSAGRSSNRPINLVDPLNQSSRHSPPRENFVDEEQGIRSPSTNHTRSTHPDSTGSPPRDFVLEQGQVASEDQIQAMIQNVAELAKNEKPDPIRPVSRRSSSHRHSESRRSSSRAKGTTPGRSSSQQRSSSKNPDGRPSVSRSRSRRESSSKRESSSGKEGERRSSSERRHSSERRRSSHHRRSSSKRDLSDRDRRSRSRSRSRSHHHRSSHHKKEELKDELKIVDEIPVIPEKQPPKRKNYGMFVFLMMLLIIPALVFVYFFLFAPKDELEEPLKILITNSPTPAPSMATPRPTGAPTEPGATPIPSLSPTLMPSPAPSDNLEGPISAFFFENNVDSNNTNAKKAVDWLVDEAYFANDLVFPLDEKYLERFAVLALYFSIFEDPSQATLPPVLPDMEPDVPDLVADIQQLGEISLPNWGMRTQDHCFWRGMVCDENGMITEVRMPNRQLTGTLPKEVGLLPKLRYVDMSKNKLSGSIPEELYDAMDLQHVYLYKNQLSGTISSKIGNLWNLTHVHLSHNQISGSIPNRMASRAKIRQLRYFNVHRNQMTGTLPADMRLRQMFYMDLGNNKFSGQLPPIPEYVRLRHLFLDHNQFSGTLPQSYVVGGNGRIQTLEVNDNQLRGAFPGNHQTYTQLMQLTIHNNDFDSMDKDTCKLDVFVGGELVEFKSQCSICKCGGDSIMCRFCV